MAEKRTTLLGLLLAAALLWGASRLTWVQVSTTDDLRGARSAGLSGATWATGLVPVALVALAAVAAVLAIRGVALRVLGGVLAVVGVVVGVTPVQLLAGADPDRAATLLEPPATAAVEASAGVLGPALALGGALLLVVAGLAATRARAQAAGLSERYQTPAARRDGARCPVDGTAAAVDSDLAERRLWDALDAGLDPTATSSPVGDAPHPPVTLGSHDDPETGRRGQGRT